ncbi:MAG: DMT family transporter, partial [Rikenellaceae bacterium]
RMKITRNSWGYYTLALFTTFLWGSAFAGAKIGFEYMPPMMLSGIRFTLAGLILVPMILFSRLNWREQIAQNWRFMLLFGFVQSFLQYGLFYMGLNLVPGAISAIIIGAGPLFIAVMAHFSLKNDKLTPRKIFAIMLGMAGVISISLTGSELATSDKFYWGVALLILSNLIGSYTNIMVVKRKGEVSSMLLTMASNLSGGLMLFLTSLFIEPTEALHQALPLEFYVAIIWLAIIPAAGFSIWYYLLALPGVKVSELNILKFTIPIIGVVLSWLLLPNEYPTWGTVLGIAIISAAVLVLQLPAIWKSK